MKNKMQNLCKLDFDFCTICDVPHSRWAHKLTLSFTTDWIFLSFPPFSATYVGSANFSSSQFKLNKYYSFLSSFYMLQNNYTLRPLK